MKFTDSHIHLSDPEYERSIDQVINDARRCNVVALVSNSTDLKTSLENLKLTEKYPSVVYSALGIHPWNVQDLSEDELQQTTVLIQNQRENKALVAIGEIGLDHNYLSALAKQSKIFDAMLKLAEQLGLPAIIHSRGTTEQVVEMLPSYRIKNVLLHWFSNPISILTKIIENGYHISEGPPTLYSNGIRDIIKRAPLTNLLTETDGPIRYFRPPFSGDRITPATIPTVVRAISEIKKVPEQTVADQVVANFQDFFNLQLQ